MVLYGKTLLCCCFLRFLLARIVRAHRAAGIIAASWLLLAMVAKVAGRWWPESTRDQMSRDTVLALTTPVANPAPLGAPLNSSLTVSFLVKYNSSSPRRTLLDPQTPISHPPPAAIVLAARIRAGHRPPTAL